MSDSKLQEILPANYYDGIICFRTFQNVFRHGIKSSDIGHEVNVSRLPGVTKISQAQNGYILFISNPN